MTNAVSAPSSALSSPSVDPSQAARARNTAEQFEASFLSQMLKPMFEGLSTEAPFGGGDAEATWRGFLLDAMAQKMVKAGGIGVTGLVMNEMLKAQESAA